MVLSNSEWALLFYIACYYSAVSLITLVLYGIDKRAAKHNKQRTPEKTLHFISLVGGWPGAFIGQKLFRHKTKKVSFQVMYWLTVIFNIGFLVLIFLVLTGKIG